MVFVCCLLLLICCGFASHFTLTGVDDNVLCNDGSPYKFYLSSGAKNKWLVYFAGGAWCFDKASCDERFQQSPNLMTSKLLARKNKKPKKFPF